jgi:sulfatase maturation enzyme AslB (radical SAM superfamily)
MEFFVDSIINDMNYHSDSKNRVIFYGGEPLLNQQDIIDFIKKGKSIRDDIEFGLYTNGTLLHTIDNFLIDNIDIFYVSIDGIKTVHNKYRGADTFELVLNNFIKIKPNLRAESIASMTITPESSVYRAVRNVVDIFDHVFWNIVNDPFGPSFNGFISNYDNDVRQLYNYWLNEIKNGRILNIVPFQFTSMLYLTGTKLQNLPCGCGTSLRAVDQNGFYLCDELMGHPEFKVALGEKLDPDKWSAKKLSRICNNCTYLGV